MFTNHLKIAWRSIARQKSSSFINVFGLATGMTVCMLILMWVQHELSYDTFHEHTTDIYRVVENQYYTGGKVFPVAVTPSALAPALKQQIPEIRRATRFSFKSLTIKKDQKFFTEGVALADPDIFEIFTIPFLKGDAKTALAEPHSFVLTEGAAEKYFGAEDPLGKVLIVDGQHDFVVTGVIKNIPENSHLKYDILAPFIYMKESGSALESWAPNWVYTYVLLQKTTSYQEVDKRIIDLIQKNKTGDTHTEIHLQPLTKIHLYSADKFTADISGHGDIQYVKIFSVVAFFVFLIACINFMNLATARSERRAKEVGLRKVIGAHRSQLIRQFFCESILLSLLAFLAALLLTELLLPIFNQLAGKSLALNQLGAQMSCGFFAIALMAGFISGTYPALFLSSFRPVQTLKGGVGTPAEAALCRKVLVVVQFVLSIVMIMGTIVVSRQIDYIRNKNLGFEKENLGYVWMAGEFLKRYETAKYELLKNPSIANITATSQLPTYVTSSTSGWDWEGKEPGMNVLMHYLSVDYDYVRTLHLQIVQGRFYSPEFPTDSLAVVVNETAVAAMGMTSPIGKRLSIGPNDLHIIGIVRDFNFKPIQTKIEPMVLLMIPNRYYAMVMRIKPDHVSSTIQFVESTYRKFNAETPFHFGFLDQDYDNLYRSEQRIGKISGYFAVIAILISCLGLYGMAAFMGEQRTKEIGIRKVLGATIVHIFVLLSRNFVLLVVLANVIAWPVAYFAMSKWLQNYAYHTSLQVTIFAFAAVVTVVIVLLTVSLQVAKAAWTNPVESLRHE